MRAEELKTIVVIGAGIMGQQIAMNTAIKGRASGYQVILCDSFPAAVEKAQAWADKYLAGLFLVLSLTRNLLLPFMALLMGDWSINMLRIPGRREQIPWP